MTSPNIALALESGEKIRDDDSAVNMEAGSAQEQTNIYNLRGSTASGSTIRSGLGDNAGM